VKQPTVQIVASPDGHTLLRIDPNPEWPAANKGSPAQATVFKYDEKTGGYSLATKFALRNLIMPSKALISNGAEFIVTLDDWDPDIGCTANVVVVYRGNGEAVKSWALEDIFTPKEIERLSPQFANVPKRVWRGENIQLVNYSGVSRCISPGRLKISGM
jgi:hypothetical protein